jgi:eukaryotic-like serine/threonine-protein kinase
MTAASEPDVPRLADRYELLGLITSGGTGCVYRARDTELDEIVAVKMLRRELVEAPEMLARFRQEVKLARRVTHKNVARTFDIGEHGTQRFITMELVEGESLCAHLEKTGPLGVAQVVDIGLAACAGLGAAHAAGVVHRDLKPENLILATDGRVVITDFGIARAAADSAAATIGVPIGTPAYMAPEQIEGKTTDLRADIYALGEILYELLTAERAWPGDSLYQVAAARLVNDPPDPRHKRPDIPTAMASLVVKCMARNPADRWASAAEVASALGTMTLPAISQVVAAPASTRGGARALAAPGLKAIAVLPFKNGGPLDDAYLAAGLTEDLVDTLSMAEGLRVRALGAVNELEGRDRDPRRVGQELGVQVVVDGSVRRSGDQLRVMARIVGVDDGFQLWAKRFDVSAGDFFKVGDEIAEAITTALTVETRAREPRRTADPAVVDLYLRARHEHQKFTPDATSLAIELYTKALERAPDDPVVLAGYAKACVRLFMFGSGGDASAELARDAAERAVRIAPGLPEPHVALGLFELAVGHSEEGARAVMRALDVGTSSPEAHELAGRMMIEVDRIERGLERFEHALGLDPDAHYLRADFARALDVLGQRERSDDIFRAFPTGKRGANLFWISFARTMAWRGDADGAARTLAMTGAQAPLPPATYLLSIVATKRIDAAQRADLANRVQIGGRALRRTAYFALIAAEAFFSAGEAERALEMLELADRSQCFDVMWFDRCPLVDPVRADARFVAMRARVAERASRVRRILGVD